VKIRETDIFTVVVLGDKEGSYNFDDCMIVSCTNKAVLSYLSGIGVNRLVYIFTKKKKDHLLEKGVLILRSRVLYLGRQAGGSKNKKMSGYNR